MSKLQEESPSTTEKALRQKIVRLQQHITTLEEELGSLKKQTVQPLSELSPSQKTEQALAKSQAHLAAIINSAMDAIITIDHNYRIVLFNTAAEYVFRCQAETAIGQPIGQFLPLEHHAKHLQQLSKFAKSQEINRRLGSQDKPMYGLRADGQVFPAEASISQITLDGDRFFTVNLRDISRRVKALQQQEESEMRLQAVLNHAPALILIKDLQQCIEMVNQRFSVITGLPQPEMIGRPLNELLPADTLAALTKHDEAALAAGESIQIEEELPHRDGSRHTYLSVKFPLYRQDKTPLGICSISTDITERKQVDREFTQMMQSLARSNKELEQFAYIVSHDLQEPLRTVAGFVKLLERRYSHRLDDDALEFINFAVQGTNRMRELIDALLAYSRVGTQGKAFVKTDCNQVLERVLKNLQGTIDQTNAVIRTTTLPTVIADPRQMEQLLQNLISNGLKFRDDLQPEIFIDAHYNRDKQVWRFMVQDNGIGIEPEYTKKIFVIFQRLHSEEQYPGTGIGLSICQKIVQRHGGEIWVESKLEQGSKFFFTLPATTAVIATGEQQR